MCMPIWSGLQPPSILLQANYHLRAEPMRVPGRRGLLFASPVLHFCPAYHIYDQQHLSQRLCLSLRRSVLSSSILR